MGLSETVWSPYQKNVPPVPQETAKLSETQKLGGRLCSVDQSRCLESGHTAQGAEEGSRGLTLLIQAAGG